jgi:hypothetical protein
MCRPMMTASLAPFATAARTSDGEDEERKGQENVGDPRDHGVDPAAVVAGDESNRNRNRHREHGREKTRLNRGASAPDDP